MPQAVEAEVAEFLREHADLRTEEGHQRVVRHGHLPEREVMTGIGPVAVRQPHARDREADAPDPERIRFSPSILPPYMRRSKLIETLLPILCLNGISTGDFSGGSGGVELIKVADRREVLIYRQLVCAIAPTNFRSEGQVLSSDGFVCSKSVASFVASLMNLACRR